MSTSPAHHVPSESSARSRAGTSPTSASAASRSRTGPAPSSSRSSARRSPSSAPAPVQPPPRTLRADDPSELLAEARVTLGCVPRDCLVMIGHSARRSSPLATRVALRDVGDGPGGVDLPRHLELLERAGCDGAFAIVLAGDGFETVEQSRTDDARRVALEVVRAAALRGPGGFDVPEAWVVSDGWADSLALTPEDDGTFALRLHQQQEPLTAPRDTLVGVQEIHAGRMVPEEDHALERELREIGDALRHVETRAEGPEVGCSVFEIAARWHSLPGALGRARAAARAPGADADASEAAPGGGVSEDAPDRRPGWSASFMTQCEPLAEVRDLLAAPDAALALLHVLAGLEQDAPDGGLDGLVRLVARLSDDPSLRPSASICAGGEWFQSLHEMRMACEGTGSAPMVGASAAAWTALGTVLAVLSWWNHRFASADDLAQEIGMRGDDEVLALFLLQIARARVRPAWRPATA